MRILAQLFLLGCLAGACTAAEAPGYKMTKRYPVPGDGGFDYIVFDGSANRIYVTHGNQVNVLDADSGKVLGKIANTPGVHGIAVVPDLNRGFISEGANARVTVFDTRDFKTVKTFPVDEDPDFVFYDPQTKRVFVCHGDAAEITAIDPAEQTVIGKISLGGVAEAAVLDGKGNGFVNLKDTAQVVEFDPKALSVSTSGRLQDARHRRVWPWIAKMDVYSSVAAAKCWPSWTRRPEK
jgi:DNA-binding beta-propeller fold protein YncE